MKNNVIPIVFASDENGIKYLSVLLTSLLINKKDTTFYDFYFLIDNGVSEKSKNIIKNLCVKYSGIGCNFINMNDEFKNVKLFISHISTPSFFRLKIADILPEKYEKAVYLDIDTIVQADLSEFFNINIDGFYVAGCNAFGIMFDMKNREYYHSFGYDDFSTYINAGVMLWNLKKIREENKTENLCKLAEKNFRCQDQDVINIFFKNDGIKTLNLKYNMMVTYIEKMKDELQYKKMCEVYGRENIEEAVNSPVIIHYANKVKPWDDKKIPFAEIWWKYANLLPPPLYFGLKREYIMQRIFSFKTKNGRSILTVLGMKISFKMH